MSFLQELEEKESLERSLLREAPYIAQGIGGVFLFVVISVVAAGIPNGSNPGFTKRVPFKTHFASLSEQLRARGPDR